MRVNAMSGSSRTGRRAPRPRDRGLELLPDLEALRAQRSQWLSLWRNLRDPTPFQSPAWLLCWAKHYAPDRTGAVAARDGDRLLALLPYFTVPGETCMATRIAGSDGLGAASKRWRDNVAYARRRLGVPEHAGRSGSRRRTRAAPRMCCWTCTNVAGAHTANLGHLRGPHCCGISCMT